MIFEAYCNCFPGSFLLLPLSDILINKFRTIILVIENDYSYFPRLKTEEKDIAILTSIFYNILKRQTKIKFQSNKKIILCIFYKKNL